MSRPKMKKDENGNLVEHGVRGYEVTDNTFYVVDIIHLCEDGKPLLDDDDQPRLRKDEKHFDSFDEYFSYLGKDIYTDACYMGWFPDPALIKKYRIDESKLTRVSSLSDCIGNHLWTPDTELAKVQEKGKQWRTLVETMVGRLRRCRTPNGIMRVLKDFQHMAFSYPWDERDRYGKYVGMAFSLFFETNEKANELILESIRKKCVPDSFMDTSTDILAYCNDPKRFAEAFQPIGAKKTVRIHKSRALDIAGAFVNPSAYNMTRCGYYDVSGFFVIETRVCLKLRQSSGTWNASLPFYKVLSCFNEFATALNNDLRGVDLSNCVLEGIDFSQYLTDEKTVFPVSGAKEICYSVQKWFSDSVFHIKQVWKDEHGTIRHENHLSFTHFADYAHFLGDVLTGSDFSLMPSNVYSRIQNTGISLDGVIPPKPYHKGSNLLLTFEEAVQNEKSSQSMLQLVRPKEGELISPGWLDSEPYYRYDGCKILYISDLHLDHIIAAADCKTIGDAYLVLNRVGARLEESFDEYRHGYGNVVAVIAGDISHSPKLFEMFMSLKYSFLKSTIVVLGNHELWAYPGANIDEISEQYRSLSHSCIAQNEILLFEDDVFEENEASGSAWYHLNEIHYSEAMEMPVEDLIQRMSSARMIMLTGIGFSGCNYEFNADSGIYRDTLSREQEIAESEKFEALYHRFIAATQAVKDRVLVVATHMPIENWSKKPVYEDGIIYISGHTHQNFFHDDGAQRIYADNQNGYYGRTPSFKCIYTDDIFDPFLNCSDGIYEINKYDYIRFYRAKKMSMTLNRDYKAIYMLKKSGYYCFLARLASGKLSIMNGGRGSSLNMSDVHYYYDRMDRIIGTLSGPLEKYQEAQKQVSKAIKSIGGTGKIHGCIVDIDFYSHVYLNPIGSTLIGYFAYDMVHKWVYGSVTALLEEHAPELYANYKQMLESETDNALIPLGSNQGLHVQSGVEYLETEIYKVSREVSKMQKLYNNVLSFWHDNLLNDSDPFLDFPRLITSKKSKNP